MARGETRVSIAGRELNVSNLDKVLFPESGFTKGQLIEYYVTVAPVMLAHIADRPLTMKRYPDGVNKPFFYEKHVPSHAPDWVRTATVPAHDNDEGITYVVLDDVAGLAWAANLGVVEMHVPLWQVGTDRPLPAPPDLVVFDLDPGEGASIVDCCAVAGWVRDALEAQGMVSVAKTSGSKGMQVYARWTSPTTWDESRACARGIAEALEGEHPELVVSNMRKSLRQNKVLIDWSQNHRAKTTVAAYSVRGLAQPTVSTPITWEEVAVCQRSRDGTALVFTTTDVLDRVEQHGDLFAPLATQSSGQPLSTYRAKRNPKKTPEPMPDKPRRSKKAATQPSFVIQEHHARALHWDFRLEHNGVLVSWALPKGLPMDPKVNHLAVQTEDHPLAYEDFEGEIPAGEYGGGQVQNWDRGTYELEKWREKEVMVVLHGERERASGRYVLFPTGGKNWMIHRMDPPPVGFVPLSSTMRPMLATSGPLPTSDAGWAYEIKWDGVRAITIVDGGRIKMLSRNDNDLSASFPEFRPLGDFLGARPCILDGEIVVMGEDGRPDFGRMQRRLHITSDSAVKKLEAQYPATYVIFDVLYLDGKDLTQQTYDERRAVLDGLALSGPSFTTAASFRDAKGADILRGTKESGLEGVVAKRRSSRYAAGRRSDEWIKVKNVRTQEVVIGGWTDGAGNRAGSLGALMVGIPAGKRLRYVGKVGTGFSDRERQELLELLGKIARKTTPFSGPTADVTSPHFVRPIHVGEVTFGEWTDTGHLRHPTWRGLRPDKDPTDVVIEA